MAYRNSRYRGDDLEKAKKDLKNFIIDVSTTLKYLVKNKTIPVNDIFKENEDKLNELLENALADLKIDYDSDCIEDKTRIKDILLKIDQLDEESLESVGLIGHNLDLKIHVYETVSKDLLWLLDTLESVPQKKKESFWRRLFRIPDRYKDVANSIMGSMVKIIPLVEPVIEFKDIFFSTKKSLDD